MKPGVCSYIRKKMMHDGSKLTLFANSASKRKKKIIAVSVQKCIY